MASSMDGWSRWWVSTRAAAGSGTSSLDASAPEPSLLDSARTRLGWVPLDKTDFAALGWTGRKAKDQSSLEVDLGTPSSSDWNEAEGDNGMEAGSRESFMQSLPYRFKQLLADSRAARNSSDSLQCHYSPPCRDAMGGDAGEEAQGNTQDDPKGQEHCTRSPFTEDVSSPHTPHLARHLPLRESHSPSTLSPQENEEAGRLFLHETEGTGSCAAEQIQSEPAAGNWRSWMSLADKFGVDWFSRKGRDVGKTSNGGDISAILDCVVGKGQDSMSVQAREAIIAEGIESVDEFQRRASSIADLVNMGVPYPMARRIQAYLRSEEFRKARERTLKVADVGLVADGNGNAVDDGGSGAGAAGDASGDPTPAGEGTGEREESTTNGCEVAARMPDGAEAEILMTQFRVHPSDARFPFLLRKDGQAGGVIPETIGCGYDEWEGDYGEGTCGGLAEDLAEWLEECAGALQHASSSNGNLMSGRGDAQEEYEHKHEREHAAGEGCCEFSPANCSCGGTRQDSGICAEKRADASTGVKYQGLVHARLTDFTSLWKSTESELVECGLCKEAAALLMVEVKTREQAHLERLAASAAAAGSKGFTTAASEMSSALREGVQAIAQGSDKARHNYEVEGMRGASSNMLAAASEASFAAGAGLVKSWQILARVAAADIDDLVSARALGLSFDHGLVSSAFEILTPEDSAPDSVIAKYSFRKPTQSSASADVCTAVGFALRPGCALHVFDYVIRALSPGARVRLGLLQETGCINLNVDGAFRTGDDSRSWAISSRGTLVHDGFVYGPKLGFELATGDVIRVIYHQSDNTLRFGHNGSIVGRQFQGVCGPAVPCVTCSQDSKCVIQISGYWTA